MLTRKVLMSVGSLAGLSLLAVAAASYGPAWVDPGATTEDFQFAGTILSIGGTAFDGEVDVTVSQSSAPYGRLFGPFRASVTNGALDEPLTLPGFLHAENAGLSLWQVGPTGDSGAAHVFVGDPVSSARAWKRFSAGGVNGAGQHAVDIGTVRMARAPLYGEIDTTGLGSGGGSVLIGAGRARPVGHLVFTDSVPVLLGAVHPLYSWSTAPSSIFRVVDDTGWGKSQSMALPRGGVVQAAIIHRGDLTVTFPVTAYPDVFRVVAFPAATYSPFDPALNPGWEDYEAFFRLDGVPMGVASVPGNATRAFLGLPAGDYVVELWTKSGLDASPPAASSTGTVSVLGGTGTAMILP